MGNALENLSNELADAVERAGRSVVRVEDGTRLTASGVAWTEEIVVATSHGVEREEDLTVETGDGRRLAATLVGRDHDADLAVLRVEGGPTPFATASARLGALALAVGRPGERGLKASLGVVSGMREAGPGTVLSTDATLYPGFSGGALVDASGALLGVLNLGWGRGRSIALDADLVGETVDAILGGGTVRRGYLGVRTQPAELPTSAGQTTGLLVAHVEADSPARAAGIAVGDVILRVEGRTTDDARGLRRALRGSREGQVVRLDVLRGGATHSLEATLGGQ